MKSTTALVLVVLATLLLGGCWPYYNHDGHRGDHGRYYGGDRGGQEYHRY